MVALNDFTPEELEQHNQALITSLQYLYQQPAVVQEISPLEQQNILANARKRLLATEFTPQDAQKQLARPPLVLLTETVLDEPVQPPALPERPRRGSRVARLFNALAAILVVGVLIAGTTLLFTLHRFDLAGMAQAHCPRGDHETLGDSGGLGYLCAQHLYQDLNITRDDGLYRVTLSRAYADQGQFVIWYHIARKINGKYQPVQLFASISVAFSTDAQPSKLLQLGVGSGNPGIQMFEMPAIRDHSAALPGKKLHVQVDLSSILVGIGVTSPYAADSDVAGGGLRTFTLDAHFTLPLNGSWQRLSLQQTQVANDISLTLVSVGYSLSMVSVDLSSRDLDLHHTGLSNDVFVSSLRVGNVECIANPKSPDFQEESPDFQGLITSSATGGGITQMFNCSLPGAGGVSGSEATMVISWYTGNPASPSLTSTWTFHFTLA